MQTTNLIREINNYNMIDVMNDRIIEEFSK